MEATTELSKTRTGGFGAAVRILCWFGVICCAGLAAFVGFASILSAAGAPQQAAGAGIACAIAIVPYVFARGVEELFRDT